MARDEELIQKAKEVREGLIAMAAEEIDATHIEVGAITAKDDATKLLTIMIGGANRLVPYQGHDTSEFTVGEYWAIIFDDYGTIRLGWWVSDAVGGGTRPVGIHKDTHKSGGSDAFVNIDLLEAIIKRLQESGGPTNLLLGAIADGQYLKRVGAAVVGAAVAVVNHNILDGNVHPDTVAQAVSRGSLIYGDSTPKWNELPIGLANRVLTSDGTDVSWALSAGAAGWTLIEDVKLGASAATIDFQNIPNTYKHLVIEYSLRTDRAASAADLIYLRFNNSAVGYDSVRVVIKHANNLVTGQTLNDSEIEFGGCITATTAPANSFGAGTIHCRDYADTSKLPNAEQHGGFVESLAAPIYSTQGFGQWRTAAAVSRITLIPGLGNNFVAGSRATLYGIS